MPKSSFDLKKAIDRYDPNGVGLTISLLGDQIRHAAQTFPKQLGLPKKKFSSLVVCGMGGSTLGADMLRRMYAGYLNVPITIVNNYKLPGFVDRSTLAIIVSYSGTTEEAISAAKDARARKVPSVIISKGGTLQKFAEKNRVPHYIFKPEYNPSNQPRLGTGYTMTAMYLIMKKARLFKTGSPDFIAASSKFNSMNSKALSLAKKYPTNSYLIIASQHLMGNAHTMSNQLNESAKAFAPYFPLPELNHHLLEGLDSLKRAQKHWTVLMLDSDKYAKRIQTRFNVTATVLKKQGFTVERVSFSGTPLTQSLSALSFSSWLSYYHAILTKRDPSEIPWVDFFKKELKRH